MCEGSIMDVLTLLQVLHLQNKAQTHDLLWTRELKPDHQRTSFVLTVC